MARPWTLGLLFLLGLSAAQAQDFYTGTDVIELTASNFKSKVLDDDHIWMIEFYAPWCGHCQRLKPDYIKAATASKGIIRFGAVNCDEHKSIGSQYNIKGFPTLKLFGTNKKRYDDYNGARTPKAMTDAALALLPNHVTLVTGKSHEDFLVKNAELPKALLFTGKSTTTALYKALALDLKERMVLGEVRAKKDAALLEKYKVEESSLPVLKVLPVDAAEGDDLPKYDGELKHKPLFKFLSKFAKPKPGKESKAKEEKVKGASSSSSSSKKAEGPKVPQLTNAVDVQAKCLKMKGFCVIALLKGEDEAATKEQVAKLGTLEEKYHKDPIKFSWVDVSKAPGIKAAFLGADDVEQPAMVLLSPKRGKYSLHGGFEGLETLLDRAIGGDVTLASKVEDGWHKSLDSA